MRKRGKIKEICCRNSQDRWPRKWMAYRRNYRREKRIEKKRIRWPGNGIA